MPLSDCRRLSQPLFVDCPACYNLVQDEVARIRDALVDLEMTLKNINENPNVDDGDFLQELKVVQEDVNRLHQEALDQQGK